jgi:hypothetical protein
MATANSGLKEAMGAECREKDNVFFGHTPIFREIIKYV